METTDQNVDDEYTDPSPGPEPQVPLWTFEFQQLVLACALRGDLLTQVPLDPELFGSLGGGPVSPHQHIATVIVDFFKEYGRRPAEAEFTQLLEESVSSFNSDQREVITRARATVQRVEPPEDPAFITDRVRGALGRRKFELGLVAAADLFDPRNRRPGAIEQAMEILAKASTPSGSTTESAPPALQTVAEAQARIGVEPTWVVDRMFAEGDLSICVALPGTGKSYFNAQLSVDVSQGTPFLGRKTKQGTVVCLLFEGARSTMARMTQFGLDARDPDVLVWTAEGDSKNPLAWLKGVLGRRRPTLIIVDTLTDFSSISARATTRWSCWNLFYW